MDKGEREIEQMENTWASNIKIYKSMLESIYTPAEELPKIQRKFDEAQEVLNLISLFRNIYTQVRDNRRAATLAANKIKNAKDAMIEAVKNKHHKGLRDNVDLFKGSISDYFAALAQIEAAHEAYKQATTDELKEEVIYTLTPEESEELYYTLVVGRKEDQEEMTKDPSKAPELERTIIAIDEAIKGLENLLGTHKFNEVRSRVEARLVPGKKDETEPKKDEDLKTEELEIIRKTFRQNLNLAFSVLFKQACIKYRTPGWENPEYDNALEVKNRILFDEFPELQMAEKLKVDQELTVEYKKQVTKFFGQAKYNVISAIEELRKEVKILNSMDLEDPNLVAKYHEVNTLARNIMTLPDAATIKLGVNLVDDVASFKFNDPDIADIEVSLLSPALKAKLNPAKKEETKEVPPVVPPVVPPKKEETKDDTKKDEPKKPTPPFANPADDEDLQYYLQLLEETNAQISEINRINSLLILHNKLSELSMANIAEDVNVETTAVHASALVSRMRTELSEARYNYLKKHGKYIMSNPEARAAKINEIRFDTNFEDFVAKRDELIVDAEIRINELMEAKPEGYQEQVDKLVEFIKAQNSLISRFLVAESVSRGLDITKFLADRNARRKALLEEKMAKKGETKTDPVPDPKKGDIIPPAPEPKGKDDEDKKVTPGPGPEPKKDGEDKKVDPAVNPTGGNNGNGGNDNPEPDPKKDGEDKKVDPKVKPTGGDTPAPEPKKDEPKKPTPAGAEEEKEEIVFEDYVLEYMTPEEQFTKATGIPFDPEKYKIVMNNDAYDDGYDNPISTFRVVRVPEKKKEEPVEFPDITIPHTKIVIRETKLRFNPRKDKEVAKKVTADDVLFKNSPKVTTTLIKNGVRIEMSKQLRERLAELNAKISLVNNKVSQSRTSRAVDAEAEYQDVTFKEDHDVNFDDYHVEVRIPGEKKTQVLLGEDEEIHLGR